jgi:hypothetical protein
MSETTIDNPPSTNGRVYLDGVVQNTRAAATPKRRRLSRLLLPALIGSIAIVTLRSLARNRD